MGNVHAQLSHDVGFTGIFKAYWSLIKPGIVLGNMIPAAGGFMLASKGYADLVLMTGTLLGIAIIIGGACVFNNLIDSDIDRKMSRTGSRPLARNAISPFSAFIYASILSILGLAVLLSASNILSTALAVSGFTVYVLFYSLYLKRRTLYAAFVGSLAGAVPPVAGYCAVTGHFDTVAIILFIIFALWQIPHCYAFSIMGIEDYINAGIPVAPVHSGIKAAKGYIIFFTGAFLAASIMLTFVGATGYFYLAAVSIPGVLWLSIACRGLKAADDRIWSKMVFNFSLLCIVVLSLMMSVDCRPLLS